MATTNTIKTVGPDRTIQRDNASLSSYIYKRFNVADDIVVSDNDVIEGIFWGASSLTGIRTNTSGVIDNQYYVRVTGSIVASGATDLYVTQFGAVSGANVDTSSTVVYDQYTNFFMGGMGTASANFYFSETAGASSSAVSGFMAISYFRENFGDKLEAGTWQIDIADQLDHTITSSFIDGTAFVTNSTAVRASARGDWDYVYSGSGIRTSVPATKNGTKIYGLVFYNCGTIILNAAETRVGTQSLVAGQRSWDFTDRIYALKGKGVTNLKSTKYFCRLTNREFNYSTNPTFFDPTDGEIIQTSFVNDPHTYATTIGLYNDANDLLAVAKIETPIEKTFDKESIISVRLDY